MNMRALSIIVIILSAALAQAALVPALTPEILKGHRRGLLRSAQGFEIHSTATDWLLSQKPDASDFIEAVYLGPRRHDHGVQPSLTVRIDPIEKSTHLRDYVSQWKRDYPRFGFEMVDTKYIRVNNEMAFLVHLSTAESDKKLRQVVFLRDKVAVILTCRDHQSTFDETVKTCNQLVRNFSWNKTP